MNHGQDPTQSPEVDHCLLKAKPGCTNRLCVALINPQWVLRRRKTRMGGLNLHWAGAQTLDDLGGGGRGGIGQYSAIRESVVKRPRWLKISATESTSSNRTALLK